MLVIGPHRVGAYLRGDASITPYKQPGVENKNKNFSFNRCGVLAPGRGQSVRSWVLRGALAKRSREARTQAPLSRASRAMGSSGTFFGSCWGSKRNI